MAKKVQLNTLEVLNLESENYQFLYTGTYNGKFISVILRMPYYEREIKTWNDLSEFFTGQWSEDMITHLLDSLEEITGEYASDCDLAYVIPNFFDDIEVCNGNKLIGWGEDEYGNFAYQRRIK